MAGAKRGAALGLTQRRRMHRHLSFLPARSWIAEFGLKQVVANHGAKACIDPLGFYLGLPGQQRWACRHRCLAGIKQQLMDLLWVGLQVEGAAMAKLKVRHL